MLSLSRAHEAKRRMCSWCFWILVMVQCCRSRRSCCPSVTFCTPGGRGVSGGKKARILPMQGWRQRGACPRDPPPQGYLGIIDQHAAPLVQLLHDLQNGHLNIHLHTFLHVGHLANPEGRVARSGLVRQMLPGAPHGPGVHLRAANLLGVLLQRGVLVPEALHQRGQELALVPHGILQELVSEGGQRWAWALSTGTGRAPTPPRDSLVVLVGIELAVPAGEGVAALTEQDERLVLVHGAVHCALPISGLGWPWGTGT